MNGALGWGENQLKTVRAARCPARSRSPPPTTPGRRGEQHSPGALGPRQLLPRPDPD